MGESAYGQLDAIRTERDKSSEWERKRTPQEQSAVSEFIVDSGISLIVDYCRQFNR